MPYDRAALQLNVLVAMAMADGRLQAIEYDRLVAIADRISSNATRERVNELLKLLLQAPPTEEDALRALLIAPGYKGLTRSLVEDIQSVARADDVVDPREERLLRLLSAVGGGVPLTLHPTAAEPLDPADRALVNRIAAEIEREEREAA